MTLPFFSRSQINLANFTRSYISESIKDRLMKFKPLVDSMTPLPHAVCQWPWPTFQGHRGQLWKILRSHISRCIQDRLAKFHPHIYSDTLPPCSVSVTLAYLLVNFEKCILFVTSYVLMYAAIHFKLGSITGHQISRGWGLQHMACLFPVIMYLWASC